VSVLILLLSSSPLVFIHWCLVGRYVLTLRLMLANLRRKLGPGTVSHKPQPLAARPMDNGGAPGPNPVDLSAQPSTIDFGSAEGGIWSLGTIPLWLQEAVSVPMACCMAWDGPLTTTMQSLTDLGLPINGDDGVFLNGPNWGADVPPIPEVW
jgi:hypothetical protein